MIPQRKGDRRIDQYFLRRSKRVFLLSILAVAFFSLFSLLPPHYLIRLGPAGWMKRRRRRRRRRDLDLPLGRGWQRDDVPPTCMVGNPI
jgi:hypothetical protein